MAQNKAITDCTCHQCGRGLYLGSRYRCCHCTMQLCRSCYLNAGLVHPGYQFTTSGNDEGTWTATAREVRTPDETAAAIQTVDNDIETHTTNSTKDTTRLDVKRDAYKAPCFYCGRDLVGQRYECLDCFEIINSYGTCRMHHDASHVFRTIQGEDRRHAINSVDISTDAARHDSGGLLEDCYNEFNGHSVSSKQTSLSLASNHRQHQTRSKSVITHNTVENTIAVTMHNFLRLTNMIKSVLRAAEETIASSTRDNQVTTKMNLLDFNLKEAVSSPTLPTPRRTRATNTKSSNKAGRPWLPEDRKELSLLKESGWSYQRIATALQRTPCAISQQWKKQSQE